MPLNKNEIKIRFFRFMNHFNNLLPLQQEIFEKQNKFLYLIVKYLQNER